MATLDAIQLARNAALAGLAAERERIMNLSKSEAVKELVRKSNVDNREIQVKKVSDSGILAMHCK